jgi:hypothetical protein
MPDNALAYAIRQTESRHLTCTERGRGTLRIAHESKNFAYILESEGGPAVELWNEGKPLKQIAKAIKRPEDETFFILWDLAERGEIKRRAGYIWGVC